MKLFRPRYIIIAFLLFFALPEMGVSIEKSSGLVMALYFPIVGFCEFINKQNEKK